jgi:hypothetical protein
VLIAHILRIEWGTHAPSPADGVSLWAVESVVADFDGEVLQHCSITTAITITITIRPGTII